MQSAFVILISRRKEQHIIRKHTKIVSYHLVVYKVPIKQKQKTAGRDATINIVHDNPTGRRGTTLFDVTTCIVAKLK
jgi:hypothetical protein